MNKTIATLTLSVAVGQLPGHAEPEPDQNEVYQLEETRLEGSQETALFIESSEPSLLRGNVSLDDVSRNVQVFNADVIETIRPISIQEIVSFASNTVFADPVDGRQSRFLIRGFDAPVLMDGIAVEQFAGVMDPDTFGLERVEVLKGPDSIQFGQSDPGGLINLVSKRPTFEDHGLVEVELGSLGHVEPRFDVGNVISEDGNIAYRLVGLYQYGDHWRDFEAEEERIFVAPSLTWRITDRTELTFLADFMKDDGPADFGTVINNNGDLVAPIERVTNHPLDEYKTEQLRAGYDFEHELFDGWTLGHVFRYVDTSYEYSALWLPFFYDPTTDSLTRVPARQKQDNEEYTFQFTIEGEFDVADFENRLVAGVDYRDTDTVSQTGFDPMTSDVLTFSNPDYSLLPGPLTPAFGTGFPAFITDSERLGLFVQDHFSITDDLILSGGLRYDEVDVEGAAETVDAFVPQVGIVYHTTEAFTLYANYSESFVPQTGAFDRNFNPVDPEEGQGYELGFRWRTFEDKFKVSAAIFHIEKTNVAVTDASPGAPLGAVMISGKQESKGIEMDVIGSPIEGLQVIGSVGYTETEDEGGAEFISWPTFSTSLFAGYAFQNSALDGLFVGAGYRYLDNRWVDSANTIELDTVLLFDANIAYTYEDWTVDLALKNITDEEYVDTANGGISRSVHPGRPFEAVLTVGYKF